MLLGLSYNHFPERQTYLKYFLTKLWKVGIHSWNKKIKIKIKELWKESLNSDGQQFHQYQQNKQSPLTEHKKQTRHMMLEIQVLAWDRHTKVVELK